MFGRKKKNVSMVDATDDFDKEPQIPEPPREVPRPVQQRQQQPATETVTLELTEAEFNFVMAMLQNAEPIRIYAASQDGEAGWNVLQKMRQMVE